MAQADVQNLVELLSNGQADETLFAAYYADVMETLGPDLWHTAVGSVTYQPATPLLSLPADLLNLLQLTYDDWVLADISLREAEEIGAGGGWRNTRGQPRGFTRQSENVKTVEVLPPSDQPNTGLVIYAQARTAELPYLTLAMALKILAREYVRESDHFDRAFAKLCDDLGSLLLSLLRDDYEPGR